MWRPSRKRLATYMDLVRRKLLACFSVYVFIGESYNNSTAFVEVLKELRWLWALLFTAMADLGRNWSTSLVSYDASLADFGVRERKFSVKTIAFHWSLA